MVENGDKVRSSRHGTNIVQCVQSHFCGTLYSVMNLGWFLCKIRSVRVLHSLSLFCSVRTDISAHTSSI